MSMKKNRAGLGGSLWDAQEQLITNSPIFAADRIRGPQLVLHDDTDTNAPFPGELGLFLGVEAQIPS